ncbi:MAG: hypothetical protein WD668_05495, partial [Saccharospirillum sp.]
EDAIADFNTLQYPIDASELDEGKVFMKWLANNHFTFLAYDEYVVEGDTVKQVEGSALGLFKKTQKRRDETIAGMSEHRRSHVFEKELLIFSKSGHRASVHRPAYSDYVLVKHFNDKGEVVGGRRFLGLYTSQFTTRRPAIFR